jgi:hypothetical protein
VSADIFNCGGPNNDFQARFGSSNDVNTWLSTLKIIPATLSKSTSVFVSIEYIANDSIDSKGINFKANEGTNTAPDLNCAANKAAAWPVYNKATPCAAAAKCQT